MLPMTLAAQDLPPYVPVNPILASRSALYSQPYIPAHPGWRTRVVIDYSNAVEVTQSFDSRMYTFDAEILEADLWAIRDLSPRTFLIGDVSLRGGYAGFLDHFLNWYHDLIGLPVHARNDDPLNTFIWNFTLPNGQHVVRQRPGTFPGDVRIGAGMRFHNAQLVGTITLPTTPSSDSGWGRGVVGTSLALTADLVRNSRFVVNGELTAGYTPNNDELASYQRTLFGGGMIGARWRFAGQQALFSTVWLQTPNWRNTGFSTMDDAEVTMDFGALIRVRHNWPELQFGATEDLFPPGPAVDFGFKFGVRW